MKKSFGGPPPTALERARYGMYFWVADFSFKCLLYYNVE